MKPATFDYFRPDSVTEAVEALSTNPDSKVLAGGQSLVPMMNMRLAGPSALVDIGRIEELHGIAANGSLRVGAATRQADVMDHATVVRGWPMIGAALKEVGHPAIRARGTFGGNIAHGDPGSELPAVMLALDATFVIEGPSGTRSMVADGFFLGHYTTALDEDELLVRVDIPDQATSHWGFVEIDRRHGDYALAGAAVRLDVDAAGHVSDARVALFGVASRPLRSAAAEQVLAGTRPRDAGVADEAGRVALEGVDVAADSFVSAAYRREATATVVERALLDIEPTEGA